jgi:hypothetical protein
MTSSPAVNASAASNSPAAAYAAFLQLQSAGGGGTTTPGASSNNAAPSPSAALLASLTAGSLHGFQGQPSTPGAAPSPSALFLARHQTHPPQSQQQGLGTPSGQQNTLLTHALRPPHPAASVAGSAVTHSAVGTTSADAPNEARRVLRALLDEQGQGRLSLARIANEVNTLIQDVYVSLLYCFLAGPPCAHVQMSPLLYSNNAFTVVPTVDPAARLADLLATLDELQVQLARTGLGALPITGENTDYDNSQALIASMASTVQGKFKHRQRIRDSAGVAKSVLK